MGLAVIAVLGVRNLGQRPVAVVAIGLGGCAMLYGIAFAAAFRNSGDVCVAKDRTELDQRFGRRESGYAVESSVRFIPPERVCVYRDPTTNEKLTLRETWLLPG